MLYCSCSSPEHLNTVHHTYAELFNNLLTCPPSPLLAPVTCSVLSVSGCTVAPRVLAGFAGTPGYLSPEILRKEPYSKPVDMVCLCPLPPSHKAFTHILCSLLSVHRRCAVTLLSRRVLYSNRKCACVLFAVGLRRDPVHPAGRLPALLGRGPGAALRTDQSRRLRRMCSLPVLLLAEHVRRLSYTSETRTRIFQLSFRSPDPDRFRLLHRSAYHLRAACTRTRTDRSTWKRSRFLSRASLVSEADADTDAGADAERCALRAGSTQRAARSDSAASTRCTSRTAAILRRQVIEFLGRSRAQTAHRRSLSLFLPASCNSCRTRSCSCSV